MPVAVVRAAAISIIPGTNVRGRSLTFGKTLHGMPMRDNDPWVNHPSMLSFLISATTSPHDLLPLALVKAYCHHWEN